MRWRFVVPWTRRREVVTSSPDPQARIRNEIQQLISIRDDGLRIAPGSILHQWINGAIFALGWSLDPYGSEPPSAPAARRRSGIET